MLQFLSLRQLGIGSSNKLIIRMIYTKAINIVVIKLPAPCKIMLGMIEPLNSFSLSQPSNNAPVLVNTNVRV